MNWHKYGAKKVEHAGRSFDSKLERALFDLLSLMEKAGEIRVIKQQAQVYLTEARILFKPDFECYDVRLQKVFYAEAKGIETSDYRIKRRLWMHYGPGDLHVYTGSYSRLCLKEIVKVIGS